MRYRLFGKSSVLAVLSNGEKWKWGQLQGCGGHLQELALPSHINRY